MHFRYGLISSGTSKDLEDNFFNQAFFQIFDTSEMQWLAGFSLNWQLHHRLTVRAGYEFRRLLDRSQQNLSSNSDLITAFVCGSNVSGGADHNHTFVWYAFFTGPH